MLAHLYGLQQLLPSPAGKAALWLQLLLGYGGGSTKCHLQVIGTSGRHIHQRQAAPTLAPAASSTLTIFAPSKASWAAILSTTPCSIYWTSCASAMSVMETIHTRGFTTTASNLHSSPTACLDSHATSLGIPVLHISIGLTAKLLKLVRQMAPDAEAFTLMLEQNRLAFYKYPLADESRFALFLQIRQSLRPHSERIHIQQASTHTRVACDVMQHDRATSD